MLKLKENNKSTELRMKALKTGDIAEIIDNDFPEYKGTIILAYRDQAFSLNRDTASWYDIHNNPIVVRLLPEGTELIVANQGNAK